MKFPQLCFRKASLKAAFFDKATADRLNLKKRPVGKSCFSRLASAFELISRTSLTYARPEYAIEPVMVGNRELDVSEEVMFLNTVRVAAAFQERRLARPAAGLAGRADVRSTSRLCCAKPSRRFCRTTTSSSPIGTIPRDIPFGGRQVRARRIYRASDHLHGSARTEITYDRDLPAIRFGAGCGGNHVRRQSSGAPGEPHPDGRDRSTPRISPTKVKRVRQEQADLMVREQPH